MNKRFFITALAVMTLLSAVSCKKDTPAYYDATVTFRQTKDGGCFIVVNDSTELHPSNVSHYPFYPFNETRAMAGYFDNGPATPEHGFKYARNVTVNYYRPMLMKMPVESQGQTKDDEMYGTEPIGLYLYPTFPCTLIEDGYLNLSFAFGPYGPYSHHINLVYNVDDDPYKMEVHHLVSDENVQSNGFIANGLASFPLVKLPDTQGKTVDVTLIWNSMKTGRKERIVLKYNTRPDWPSDSYSNLIN
ncbi:MAG: hypothetical protein MJY55_00515 [Bacteroidales bacterium]|nr:hypothetical protein [Bacteroidales bacterium]